MRRPEVSVAVVMFSEGFSFCLLSTQTQLKYEQPVLQHLCAHKTQGSTMHVSLGRCDHRADKILKFIGPYDSRGQETRHMADMPDHV